MTLIERIERGMGDAEDARIVERLIEALAAALARGEGEVLAPCAAALAEALRTDR